MIKIFEKVKLDRHKVKNKKVKFIQPQFETMRAAHLLFYSYEPAYKMT